MPFRIFYQFGGKITFEKLSFNCLELSETSTMKAQSAASRYFLGYLFFTVVWLLHTREFSKCSKTVVYENSLKDFREYVLLVHSSTKPPSMSEKQLG